MMPIHTILCPSDFSDLSLGAFHLACSLARTHGSRVVVLHVYPPPLNHAEAIARDQPDGYEDSLWSEIEKIKSDDPSVPVEYGVIDGFAADEIVRSARENAADLIVMGTHGRSGLRRALMGSVAEKVLRHAPCSVLTVNRPVATAELAVHAERAAVSSHGGCHPVSEN
jgi:universal stress protein A